MAGTSGVRDNFLGVPAVGILRANNGRRPRPCGRRGSRHRDVTGYQTRETAKPRNLLRTLCAWESLIMLEFFADSVTLSS